MPYVKREDFLNDQTPGMVLRAERSEFKFDEEWLRNWVKEQHQWYSFEEFKMTYTAADVYGAQIDAEADGLTIKYTHDGKRYFNENGEEETYVDEKVPEFKGWKASEQHNQVKEASNAFSALMEKAHEEGKAVWQMSSEDRSSLRAPVLVYKDKEGNDKTFSPPVANMLPAVQHQLEIGSKDSRWILAKGAAANPDIAIRKGAKAVTFILFTKDKQPYTKKFFNMADVSGKGVPALTPAPELRRDVYLHDMIDYLARRAERGTFKDGNYFMMFTDAKEAANKSYQAKKEVYDFSNLDYETYMRARMEAQRRLDVILKADVQTPVPEKDYEKAFIQLLAKEIRKPSITTNYVIRAARKALNELKWQESHVKAAMKAFVPQSAFDSLARRGKEPSNTLLIIAVKGLEPQKKQEQAAAR